MTDLLTLSRHVSEADGPDRYLDAEVMLFVRPELAKKPYAQNRIGNWLRMDGRSEIVPAPQYTASLDAVAALIAEKLPGFKWSLHKSGSPYIAGVTKEAPVRTMPHMGVAKTPALALLSATLLAIHERNKSDG